MAAGTSDRATGSGGRRERLAAIEYRHVQPEDRRATLARADRETLFRRGAIAELRRRLAEDPGCRRAREMLEALGAGLTD